MAILEIEVDSSLGIVRSSLVTVCIFFTTHPICREPQSLSRNQFGVLPFQGDQLVMCALLDYLTGREHNNVICISDGEEMV